MVIFKCGSFTFEWSERKEEENPINHPGLTMKRAARIFTLSTTRRRFYDYDHTTIYELHRYALVKVKVKGHGVVRINYEFREYNGIPVIHLIDAFNANVTDSNKYYYKPDDW